MHSCSRKGTISIYLSICNGRRRGLLRSIPAVIPLSGIEVQLKGKEIRSLSCIPLLLLQWLTVAYVSVAPGLR